MGDSSPHGRSEPGPVHGSKVASSSSSASEEQSQHKNFKWTINGFSSLLDKGERWTYSRVFEIMGHEWFLKLKLSYEIYDLTLMELEEYITLSLELEDTYLNLDTFVEASFKFRVYDQSYGKHIESQVTHKFLPQNTSSKGSNIISRLLLYKQPSGFLVDNSCVFGVEFIEVATYKSYRTSKADIFKWSIDGFSSVLRDACPKMNIYSRMFGMMGHSWFLKLSTQHYYIDNMQSDTPSYINLSLELAPTPGKPDTCVEASFKFLIYDQSYGKHMERQVSHKFLNANTSSEPSSIISLKEMKKRSSDFLVNNSCIFGVEFVNVFTAET